MSFNVGWRLPHAGYDATTGCVRWPEDEWPNFELSLGKPAAEQGYFYVQDLRADTFIGHVHYEVDSEGEAHIGLNVIPTRRGAGLGSAFMALLLDKVWQGTEACVAVNDFEDSRVEAVRLHRSCGFVPGESTTDTFGRPTRTWRLRRPTLP